MKKTIFILMLILLIGCNQNQGQTNLYRTNTNQTYDLQNTKVIEESTDATGQKDKGSNQENVRKAENLLLSQKEVKRVRIVEGKKLLIAAIELNHWNTFQSKKLTKEFKKKLEKEIPSKKVEATTDHKIYLEIEKLLIKIENNEISNKELEKKLKKLQKLMKEQT
ncbi:YhcN/YlaJ family sporulation lipoprotein [Calidifontibacillus oryziterrae]|uniref:YhcN/YlaJ family sporulation lipoprotein n=1 Tax=Calidifontibacillus oryziterrae TaxID=1191699 RepID=UPI0002D805A2|nr:YhcN/YlaJ family sporulation lipoprotein [Calidifontibacillus oryziterrae]